MATASGLDAQLGIADEVTYGTRVAATRFWEFMSENVKMTIDRIDSQGIRAGRKTLHRWHPSRQRVVGGWKMELSPQGLGLWQKHAFGVDTITGSNPYTHTSVPSAALDGKSFTLQIGRPSLDGTVRVHEYTGCKITDWDMSFNVGELVMMQTNIYGANETTNQSLATATYPTGLSPFVFTHGALTIGGTELAVITGSLKGTNGLEIDRHRLSATTPAQPRESKESTLREYTGTLTCDYNDLTQYNRFVNGTEAALVLTFNAGASATLTITTNARYDGETPDVGGRQLVGENVPFKCVSTTGDSTTLTWATINADVAS